MYEDFYGLTTRPFSKTPDPEFLFLSRSHEEALARLQYAVEEKEIVMLSGDVGCGKTTLTRALIDSLGENHRVVLILNPRLTPTQLLRLIAKRFGIEVRGNYKDSILEAIHEKVYTDYEQDITPVIIVDEAQLIPSKDTFEELRLLTNFQLDDTNLLSLVFVGQPDLREKMNRKVYMPLKQRIGLFYHLSPLSEDDIKGYIEHRLKIAGRTGMLFTDDAVAHIFVCSGGVPRIINSIADTALIEGLGAERDIIDKPIVLAAARELGLEPFGVN